jgi:hypothetical protein
MPNASLDRWITGECWPWRRRSPVWARCPNGHEWPTMVVHELGRAYLELEDCDVCGEPAEGTEPRYDGKDE